MFVFSLKRYKKCLLFYTSRCHQSDLDTQQHQQQRQHRLEQQHGVECTPLHAAAPVDAAAAADAAGYRDQTDGTCSYKKVDIFCIFSMKKQTCGLLFIFTLWQRCTVQ